MTVLRCSQGHSNPPESRFCHLCGEKLAAEEVYPGVLLSDRYRILGEIGHGGFGRTYLAQDINRFDEACVLKEFAPQVRGTYALQKSEELFEREAGVLYKLQHPQIPRFRELFRANLGGRGHLFLVQDFVEGSTYRQLLEARRPGGFLFSDPEIHQLLEQLLLVLDYIHSNGVIHRDISPDNLILRTDDQLPVLIDFGGVKQVAVAAASQYMAPGEAPLATRLGKVGYAPTEQMHSGLVSPQSDLYALAATALVLMTGREPLEFLGDAAPSPWQQIPNLSTALSQVFAKMLAVQPADRFPTAQAALQALSSSYATVPPIVPPPSLLPLTMPPSSPIAPTQPFMPTHAPTPTQSFPPTQALTPPQPDQPIVSAAVPARRSSKHGIGVMLLLAVLVGIAGAGWATRDRWLPSVQSVVPTPAEPSPFTPEEQQRKEALQTRRQALGIDQQFLVNLTNATFYDRYPEQQGRTLSEGEADAPLRQLWDGIADEWLTLLEQTLSAEARSKLGSYTNADRDQWKREVNQLYVGSRSLFDLTDARFFHLFPKQRGQDFIGQPIGQVWQAIAADQVKAIQDRKTLTPITFGEGTFSHEESGTLAPGEGHLYTARLNEGQIMRVNLQAPASAALFSVYLPRPGQESFKLPEDSSEFTWAGRLPQSGYYEFVIVANAAEPLAYQLNLAIDNVTSTPAESPNPEAPEAKD
ncbi:protein kinase [Phormidium tenue FACHB-886]|nr:protein kinase [Phormidium tenue FACHB-886]